MRVTSWSCSLPDGRRSDELAVHFDEGRRFRLLVLPALFDEANKLRRQTVEVMRRLSEREIDSILPDLPGTNESFAPQAEQTFNDWKDAARQAAAHFGATHVLAWRASALIAPDDMPGWRYAPTSGAKQLRSMLRARTIVAREAGQDETIAGLQEMARREGIELAGWQLGAQMFAALEAAVPVESPIQTEIAQSEIGGAGLWLRAEPDEDRDQAIALATLIADALERQS
ncbi:hypothetical protein [Altererythrobacter sp.]|uniref:hypothetical protein n=1 Tax=Altererythrobacter sp. TaxID=1872480 RepID=UPI003D07B010